MNGVLILDKPSGCTSHDVTARARGLLHQPHLGHLGTLDPLATGVLPLLVGDAARLAEYAPSGKTYEASCLLDRFTDTDDVSGEIVSRGGFKPVSAGEIRAAILRLREVREQVPPMVSAVRVDGKKLYELARKGKTVERKPRPIEIRAVECLEVEWPRARFRVECSGGTYIRSLCHTLGEWLGTGGCLETLRRLKSGPFSLEEALSWQVFEAAVREGREVVQPSSRLVAHLPRVMLDESQAEDILHGRALETLSGAAEGWVCLMNPAGKLAAMAEVAGGKLKPRKVFGADGI